MMMRNWFCLALLTMGTAAAGADRPDLNGTWKLDPAHSKTGEEKVQSEMLLIHQTDDGVTIADSQASEDGKEKKLDIQCNTMGKECKLKDGAFSLWYNGPVLVVMQTHGDAVVVKRRIAMSEDGSKLTMDVIHIAPDKPAESYTFVKQ
jgi:hypothetical protein